MDPELTCSWKWFTMQRLCLAFSSKPLLFIVTLLVLNKGVSFFIKILWRGCLCCALRALGWRIYIFWNTLRCYIVPFLYGDNVSPLTLRCQIVLYYTAVLNCPGAKLSPFTLRCQIVPGAKLSWVPNCPFLHCGAQHGRCQIVLGAKLSQLPGPIGVLNSPIQNIPFYLEDSPLKLLSLFWERGSEKPSQNFCQSSQKRLYKSHPIFVEQKRCSIMVFTCVMW